jgi:hypothetical protein
MFRKLDLFPSSGEGKETIPVLDQGLRLAVSKGRNKQINKQTQTYKQTNKQTTYWRKYKIRNTEETARQRKPQHKPRYITEIQPSIRNGIP